MSEQTSVIIPLVSEKRYRLNAYSATRALNIRGCKAALWPEPVERHNQDCLIVQREDEQYLFIWDFGTVVFFNIPIHEHEQYLSKLGIVPQSVPSSTDGDLEDMAEDFFILDILDGPTKVAFNAVTISDFDLSKLQLVAEVLAQSSALELVEWEVEKYLKESDAMADLMKSGWIRGKRERVLRFLGEGLSTRHRIVNQLYLLEEPEKTWEKEELYLLYRGLLDNFDIKERIEKIEHMISLCSDVSQILLGIMNSRRSETLEMIIILLIVIEIVRPLFA